MIIALDRRTILASALLAAAMGPAAAQEKITLRLAESLPAGHVIHELVAKPFMELVTKGTNGQITFQHYPAEQLGKAGLRQAGVLACSNERRIYLARLPGTHFACRLHKQCLQVLARFESGQFGITHWLLLRHRATPSKFRRRSNRDSLWRRSTTGPLHRASCG